MALPEPVPGLVISYDYLWAHEYGRGRREGAKARPCVVVLRAERVKGIVIVTVAPITHRLPEKKMPAVEIPAPVKRHLGLDADRSWVVLDDFNRFIWPGFDLRPISRSKREIEYGMLPPRFFAKIVTEMKNVWTERRGRLTER